MQLPGRTVCTLSVLALLTGCAGGNTVSDWMNVEPVPAGMSRIVVYRTQVGGAAVQPHVRVDDRETGKCQPEGAFTVDVLPGEHTLSAKTETLEALEITTSPGETVYVECSITFGVMVGHPKLTAVAAETGREAVKPLSLIGQFAL